MIVTSFWNPKLSIIIPTKERYGTLLTVMDVMLLHFGEDVEFVVQDNTFDNSVVKTYLEMKNDFRIKYFHCSKSISIVENTELAIGNSSGQYLCFIGDDDLVLPNIMDAIKEIEHEKVDVAVYPGAFYWWKNVSFKNEDYYNKPGSLWVPVIKNSKRSCYSSMSQLDSLLNGGCVSIGALPKLYHGLVKRDALLKVKQAAGKFVLGASPDMALAISLALVDAKVLFYPEPLTVYGASKNSGGGYTAENKHFGKISEQKHIPDSTKNNWCKLLPDVWSEHTVYPQTVIEVYDKFGLECPIDYTKFYASMYVNEPHLRDVLFPYIRRYFKVNRHELPKFCFILLAKYFGRFRRYATYKLRLRPFIVKSRIDISEIINIFNDRNL